MKRGLPPWLFWFMLTALIGELVMIVMVIFRWI